MACRSHFFAAIVLSISSVHCLNLVQLSSTLVTRAPVQGCQNSCYASINENTAWEGNGNANKCSWRNCKSCSECTSPKPKPFDLLSKHSVEEASDAQKFKDAEPMKWWFMQFIGVHTYQHIEKAGGFTHYLKEVCHPVTDAIAAVKNSVWKLLGGHSDDVAEQAITESDTGKESSASKSEVNVQLRPSDAEETEQTRIQFGPKKAPKKKPQPKSKDIEQDDDQGYTHSSKANAEQLKAKPQKKRRFGGGWSGSGSIAEEENRWQHEEATQPDVPVPYDWGIEDARETCPSMFVVIMSRRGALERRSLLRQTWGDNSEDWGDMKTVFGLCKQPALDNHEPENFPDNLQKEVETHDDILMMDCTEGYKNGRLTRKAILAMQSYLKYPNYELFMKTDDDTFVSMSRLCGYLSKQPQKLDRFQNSYMGVFFEEGEHPWESKKPCRDPGSAWYEPEDRFSETMYPPSAKGGPGYILSRQMVAEMINAGIAEKYVLNNEDKAVGVWVEELKRTGMAVESINLPGTDGYEQFHKNIRKTGNWNWYPYVLHHHLEPKEINCLRKQELEDDNADVAPCFIPENHIAMSLMSSAHGHRADMPGEVLQDGGNNLVATGAARTDVWTCMDAGRWKEFQKADAEQN